MKKRKEIEREWRAYNYFEGKALCDFCEVTEGLNDLWLTVWEGSGFDCTDSIGSLVRHDTALTYLTRALSLNILLDDNNIE